VRHSRFLSPVRPATCHVRWQVWVPSRGGAEVLPRRIVRTPSTADQPIDAAGDLSVLDALNDRRCVSPGLQFAGLWPGVSLP
jgi:hypothetical protein